MLLKVAVVILVAWFLGRSACSMPGGSTHVPLLVGLMLLLLAVPEARDAAMRRTGIAALTNHE